MDTLQILSRRAEKRRAGRLTAGLSRGTPSLSKGTSKVRSPELLIEDLAAGSTKICYDSGKGILPDTPSAMVEVARDTAA